MLGKLNLRLWVQVIFIGGWVLFSCTQPEEIEHTTAAEEVGEPEHDNSEQAPSQEPQPEPVPDGDVGFCEGKLLNEEAQVVDGCLLSNLTQCQGADLSNMNLEQVSMSCAKLHDINFSGANLVNAQFIFSDLSGSNFNGADLTGANLANAYTAESTFEGAILNDTKCPSGRVIKQQGDVCNFADN